MIYLDQAQTVDVLRENPILLRETPLEKGDVRALRWMVTVMQGKEPADLSGMTVGLYAARRGANEDERSATVFDPDAASIAGNVITAILPQDAAAVPGQVVCLLRLGEGERAITVARMAFVCVDTVGTDVTLPAASTLTYEQALSLITEAEKAAGRADEAAAAANEAAENVPHIGANGNWIIGETDTGIKAQGEDGPKGDPGLTPHIGDNGNWFIGETDTGVKAQGPQGDPGLNGTGYGTVTGVKVGETTYEPDERGVVDLGSVGGNAGPSLPTGGTAGQMLVKQSGTDGDAGWKTVAPGDIGAQPAGNYALKTDTAPDSAKLGGVAADEYAKKTDLDDAGKVKSVCGKEADESGNVDLDAADVGAVSIPNEDDPTYGVATGINADMLGGVAASEYAKKSEIPEASTGLPAGGSAGQVLTKNSDADDDAVWADPPEAGAVEWENINNKPTTFTPSAHTHDPVIATADTLGCVKVGDGLSVAADGTISANTSSGVKAASEMKFICFSSQDLYGGMRQYINDVSDSDVTYNHLYAASMMITDIDQYFIVQSVSASSGRAYIMVRRIWDSEEFPDNLWFSVIYD